jgi:hypothetical protein
MRRIELDKGKLVLTEGIIGFFQKTVTKFGTGAKIDSFSHLQNPRSFYISYGKSNVLIVVINPFQKIEIVHRKETLE